MEGMQKQLGFCEPSQNFPNTEKIEVNLCRGNFLPKLGIHNNF